MEPLSLFYTTTVIVTVFTIILTIFPHLSQMRNLTSDETMEPRRPIERQRRSAVDGTAEPSVPKLHEIQVRLNVESKERRPTTRRAVDRHTHPHAQYWAYGSGRMFE